MPSPTTGAKATTINKRLTRLLFALNSFRVDTQVYRTRKHSCCKQAVTLKFRPVSIHFTSEATLSRRNAPFSRFILDEVLKKKFISAITPFSQAFLGEFYPSVGMRQERNGASFPIGRSVILKNGEETRSKSCAPLRGPSMILTFAERCANLKIRRGQSH
jgi:hypothetical protein